MDLCFAKNVWTLIWHELMSNGKGNLQEIRHDRQHLHYFSQRLLILAELPTWGTLWSEASHDEQARFDIEVDWKVERKSDIWPLRVQQIRERVPFSRGTIDDAGEPYKLGGNGFEFKLPKTKIWDIWKISINFQYFKCVFWRNKSLFSIIDGGENFKETLLWKGARRLGLSLKHIFKVLCKTKSY